MADTIQDDLPLDDTPLEEDLPLPEWTLTKAPRPEEIDNMYRGQVAAVKSELDGTDVFTAFDSIDPSEDPKAQLNLLSEQRSVQTQSDLRDYFNRNLGVTSEEIANNVGVYQELIAEQETRGKDPAYQVVESLSGVGAEDSDERYALEADLLLMNTLSDMIENYSTLEKAFDFGKMLLPTSIIDNVQVTGSAFDAESFMRDIVIGMKDLRRNDPQKFQEVFPSLMLTLEEDLPKGKTLSVLAAIANPRGEEDLEFFGKFDAALDVVDLATMGAFAAQKIARLTHKLNAIRVAAKLNNKTLAADVNAAAMLDETGEVAKSAGISKDTAINNAAPFNVSELDTAYAEGLSTEVVSRIQTVKAQQRKVTEIIRTNDGLLREEILTPSERLAAEEKFSDSMQQMGFENIRVLEQSPKSTTFSYTVTDPATGDIISDTQKMDLTLDQVTGSWRVPEFSTLASYVTSPTVFAKHALGDVNSAIRMDYTSANIGKLFQGLQREALEPILGKRGIRGFRPKARRELAEVDAVLRAGDEFKDASGVRGKVYTPDELRGGVVNGVPLNDRQIETYYNIRGLYDELWVIRNDETRDLLKAQGKKEIDVRGVPAVGKEHTQEGAVAVINSGGQVKVYHSGLDDASIINGSDIDKLYSEGFVLSKLDEAIQPLDTDELFDLVIVPKEGVKDLPERVLHFREGYVPKVNRDAFWFVKKRGNVTINGVTRADQVVKTERMFSSRTEAEAWAKAQKRDDLVVLPDRALEQEVLGSSQVGSGGGLYTGARASEDIPFGTEGLPAERLNTYEALSQNLQSLENYVTRNQWRLAMQQRWINSAKAAGFENIDRFEKALIPVGDPRGKFLRRMADQIEIWSGFPTQGEQLWDGFLSGVMEWSLNSRFTKPVSKQIARGVNYLRRRENNPVALARGAAFHSLLGVFNPAQAWVQAQGAVLSMSLAPNPIKAYRLQTALQVAQHLGKDTKAAKLVAKAADISEEELALVTKLWNKTGFEQSVENTADLAAAAKGFGVTRQALKRVFDKGLFFYRSGELFNRRYAFLAALQRAEKKLGTINLTDAQLRDVVSDASNMMLNLSKSNAAAWQRGVVAIPTQFLQVQAKFLESVFGTGKSFTIRERMRILAGQVGLYGAAGIPLGGLGAAWGREVLGFSQKDIEEAPEAVTDAINGGIWQVMAHQMLGADIDLASRGAISEGMTQFTLDLMFSESTVGEKAVGAFGTIPHRFYQAWKNISPMVLSDREDPLTKEEILQGVNSIASIASSWNNLQKGLFMQNYNMLLDSKNRVVEEKDFNLATEVSVMIGFQPSELKRVRDRNLLLSSRKEYRAQVADAVIAHYWNYVKALKGVETEKERASIIRNYKAGTDLLMKSLRNEGERNKVREAVNRRLESSEDQKSKSIRQFIEEFADGQVVELGSMVAAARTSGLIRNDLDLNDKEGNK